MNQIAKKRSDHSELLASGYGCVEDDGAGGLVLTVMLPSHREKIRDARHLPLYDSQGFAESHLDVLGPPSAQNSALRVSDSLRRF